MSTPFESIPGPDVPWWGLPHLFGMRRDYLGYSEQLQRSHGDLVRLRLGAERAVEVFDPELLRQALVEHADAMIRWSRGPEVFAESSGQNVLVTEGATWQRQRRLLMQAFTPRKVAGYAALMAQATHDALQLLPHAGTPADRPVHTPADTPADTPVDMDAFFSHLTMDVILRTLFGAGASTDPQAAAQAVQTLSEIGFKAMFWPASPPDWLPLPANRRKRRALVVLRRVIEAGLAGPAGDATLLAMLRAARDEATGAGLADQEVYDQCMISFQAGHETTATALLWWSALLVRHPEAAARAHAEVDEVLGQGEGQGTAPAPGGPADLPAPTPGQLARMPWLAATLKEAMRLYPPVAALMTRRATQPVRLGEHEIPARVLIRLTPWVLHRDARWFPEPDRFRPERFMPGAPELPRGAYVPFGVGPRVCLGQHFATLEMGLVAAMLLQRHELALPPGTPAALPAARMHITLRPAEPVRLLLRPRQRAG